MASLTPRTAASQAFSLIEVTLAMGLLSFCLLTVMGLIPVGLTSLRRAVEQTVVSQIAQQLNGEILLTPYSQLATKYGGQEICFDEAGGQVADLSKARYKAQMSLSNPIYPGSTNAPTSTPIVGSIQTVQLNIVKTSGEAQSNRYTIQVPNSGN